MLETPPGGVERSIEHASCCNLTTRAVCLIQGKLDAHHHRPKGVATKKPEGLQPRESILFLGSRVKNSPGGKLILSPFFWAFMVRFLHFPLGQLGDKKTSVNLIKGGAQVH